MEVITSIKTLFDNGKSKVLAVYSYGTLLYTRTVVYGEDGEVVRCIVVNSDGTCGIV